MLQKSQQQQLGDKSDNNGTIPELELAGNPSSFAVYSGVRQSVLTGLMQKLSASLHQSIASVAGTESDDESDQTAANDALFQIPKVGLLLSFFFLFY